MKLDVIMLLFVVWVIFHSNAMYLIEPEGKEWVPFPWCWVSGVRQVDSHLGSAVFSHLWSAQLCPFPVGFAIYWGPGCLEICWALGCQDVWFYGAAQAEDMFESFLTGLWIYLLTCWRFFFQTEVCTPFFLFWKLSSQYLLFISFLKSTASFF